MTEDRVKVVTFDKDSTLSDASHRRWMAEKIVAGEDGLRWMDWARACTGDTPIKAALTMAYLLAPYYPIFVLSGSSDCPEGRAWLRDHRVPCSDAFFRPPGDESSSNGALKVQWIRKLQGMGYEVAMHVDDDVRCAEVIEQETGVRVLTVNPRYSRHAPETT